MPAGYWDSSTWGCWVKINDDDIEEMDLKWQVAMISMRIKKFYKRTGRKLQFDTKDPVGFDKTKVECFNCHKMRHFARDCRAKGNQDNKRRDDIDWSGHVEKDAQNYAMMAYSSGNSCSDNENTVFHSKTKNIEIRHYFVYDAYEKKLIQVLKIHTDDNVADLLTKAFYVSSKDLASPKQTALGKDTSNLLIVDCLLKTIWLSKNHVISMKHWLFQSKQLLANDVVKLRALIDGKRVVVTEDVIRQDLRLDDADDVECLPNKEIFTKLALQRGWREMNSVVQRRLLSFALLQYTSPALTQKVFANMRRVGKGFLGVETPLFATMLVQPQPEAKVEQHDVEVPVANTPPSPTNEPSPPPQEPITTPSQAQPAPPSSPTQEQ
nr:ribonuclease H-like domain-containing protein [Tanacetum cinerariifolium]